MRMPIQRTRRRVLMLATGLLGVGLAAGSFSLAGAAEGSESGRPGLTDAQKSCLEAQGVARPVKPADGTHPTPPTDEQRAKMKAAAAACGLPEPAVGGPRGPGRAGGPGNHPELTDAQKSCLEAQGVARPVKPADGTHPTPPSGEQRAKFEAAAQACGIARPARPTSA
jgi:hypothetical protein